MKLQIVSDLHLDFYDDRGESVIDRICQSSAETLVIAGDLAEVVSPAWRFAIYRFCQRYDRVLYVLGNHEYYHSSPCSMGIQAPLLLAELENDNLVAFHRRSQHILPGKINIEAWTLWFRDMPDVALFRHTLNDFKQIGDFEPWVYQQSSLARMWLADSEADIVITHHLPNARSVPERYRNSRQNCFYVNDVMPTMKQLPKLWIHGHTHTACDYMLGDCRVVANPLGYPGEHHSSVFNYDFTIDLAEIGGGIQCKN